MKDAILWTLFFEDLTFRLDRPCRLVFRVLPRSYFGVLFQIELPVLTLDRLFNDKQYLTLWNNVTMHYALVGYSRKVCTMLLRVLWM